VWECRGTEHLRRFVVSHPARALLLAAVTLCLIAPSAGAHPTGPLLGDLWTTVLQTPGAENPFVTGDAVCLHLRGHMVAPFTPDGFPQDSTCTVKRGTKIFVAGSTFECSSFIAGDHVGFGTTEAELRKCARQNDAQVAPEVTVDGRSVTLTAVETRLLRIHLPSDNVFGVTGADRRGQSVAHGWVVVLKRLTRGTHTIVNEIDADTTNTTTLIVK
jgi:hypothetical protein